MKKYNLSFAFAVMALFFLASCGNSQSAKEEESQEETPAEEVVVEDPILTMDLNSVDKIEDWVALIALKLNAQEFPVTDAKMITRGDKTFETVVLNPGGRVQIVRAGSPTWTTMDTGFRYFTRDGNVVALEELLKVDDGYHINSFHYADGKVLRATTRSGATIEEARSSVPGDFVPDGVDDFMTDYSEVKARSDRFLGEVLGS